MEEIRMPVEEFNLGLFVDHTADFMRKFWPAEEEPGYGVVYASKIGDVLVFVFGPDAGADALCALREDGQIGFFPFAYTDGVRLYCADRIEYLLFMIDMKYQDEMFIGPEDSFGFLVQIKDGAVIMNSAIQTYRDSSGYKSEIDHYPNTEFLEKAMESFILGFKYEKEFETERCGDCGCIEGQLHVMGCDQEHCPFCGGQLISCDCVYEILGLVDKSKYGPETSFLPPSIYKNGLTRKQEKRWLQALNEKGRRPFIRWPILCARCGKQEPFFFNVPDEDWETYIDPRQRRKVICRDCYLDIVRLIDVAERR